MVVRIRSEFLRHAPGHAERPNAHAAAQALAFSKEVVDMSAWTASLCGQLAVVSEGSCPQLIARTVRALPLLARGEELADGESGVLGDPAEERWCDIATAVEWHGSSAAVRVAVLTMRAPLPQKFKAEPLEQRLDLPRLQDRHRAQGSGYLHCVRSYELCI